MHLNMLPPDLDNISKLVEICFGIETVEHVQRQILSTLEETPDDITKPNFYRAFDNGEFVGFCAYAQSRISTNIYELLWSAVHPSKRHKGIATMMLDYRLARIKEMANGIPYGVMVQTHLNQLYVKRGFVPVTKTIKLSDEKDLLYAEFPA